MASRSFRCTKTPKENPMKSERYKGVSGESRRGTQECVRHVGHLIRRHRSRVARNCPR